LKFAGEASDDRLLNGVLRCFSGHLYQIKDEIPILKDPKLSEKEFSWNIEFPSVEKYDEIRKEYSSYLSEELGKADEALLNEIASSVSNENLILDVASGMGRLLLALSRKLSKDGLVIGTDIDEKPLRGAKLKLEEQKSYKQISLCVMDGKLLAIKSRKLTCVTSYFGFDNIPETKKAFQEAFRVLMPKGRLIFANLWFKEGSMSLALAEKFGFGAIATKDKLFQTLEEAGFKIDSTEEFYSGQCPYNPMDLLPLEGDWFAHILVKAHKR
jgi:ubiquinone/menaquinone biosynthesis C-methylase UbiE